MNKIAFIEKKKKLWIKGKSNKFQLTIDEIFIKLTLRLNIIIASGTCFINKIKS